MTFRKYLVLAGVTLCASIGDSLLSRGMKQMGSISLHHPSDLILAVLNPSVAVGILLLLGFFASYMTALSWADSDLRSSGNFARLRAAHADCKILSA